MICQRRISCRCLIFRRTQAGDGKDNLIKIEEGAVDDTAPSSVYREYSYYGRGT